MILALALLAFVFSDAANVALAVGAILGGIGYAVAQWSTSRRRGENDAFQVAVQEVEAIKLRADRLEKEVVALQGEVHALRKENEALRSVIATRNDLDQKLLESIENALQRQTRRLVDVMREGRSPA